MFPVFSSGYVGHGHVIEVKTLGELVVKSGIIASIEAARRIVPHGIANNRIGAALNKAATLRRSSGAAVDIAVLYEHIVEFICVDHCAINSGMIAPVKGKPEPAIGYLTIGNP
jgi:hypothetical protein